MKLLLTIIFFIGFKLYEIFINPFVFIGKWCVRKEKWFPGDKADTINIIILGEIIFVILGMIAVCAGYLILLSLLSNYICNKLGIDKEVYNGFIGFILFILQLLIGGLIWFCWKDLTKWLKSNWKKASDKANKIMKTK
jgi:hypothetical protein